jgi:hypothetical protein
MTFKHVKFEDSPTMRALEKVAREKGLVKPEPLTKKASLVKKADLTPSDNLMENILKLCSGLREQGFVKDASDLETKYLQYKQAQTLYETSKETGEDLLGDAHPEGSHKLVDVDSAEAVVEDLLDKHDMIEEVAEKDSKGKLSDASSVIRAVKKVLGQVVAPKESESDLIAAQRTQLGKITSLLSNAVRFMDEDGGDYDKDDAHNAAKDMRDSLATWPFKIGEFHAISAAFTRLQGVSNSGNFKGNTWVGNMLNLEPDESAVSAWNKRVGPAMTALSGAISTLGNITTKLENIEILRQQGTYKDPGSASGAPGGVYAGYRGQIDNLKGRYQLYQARQDYDRVPPANKQKVIDFLGAIKVSIDNLSAYVDQYKTNEGVLTSNKGDLDAQVADIARRLDSYKNSVIAKAPQTGPGGR